MNDHKLNFATSLNPDGWIPTPIESDNMEIDILFPFSCGKVGEVRDIALTIGDETWGFKALITHADEIAGEWTLRYASKPELIKRKDGEDDRSGKL